MTNVCNHWRNGMTNEREDDCPYCKIASQQSNIATLRLQLDEQAARIAELEGKFGLERIGHRDHIGFLNRQVAALHAHQDTLTLEAITHEAKITEQAEQLIESERLRENLLTELAHQLATLDDSSDKITEQAADLARVTESCKHWQALHAEQAERIKELIAERSAHWNGKINKCPICGEELRDKLATLTSQRDRLVAALKHHIEQTRPIYNSTELLAEIEKEMRL